MRVAPPFYPTAKCPRCSFSIPVGLPVCDHCGSFVPVEEVASYKMIESAIHTAIGKRAAELRNYDIAFALACIPLLIGPPVAALAIIAIKSWRDRSIIGMREWQRPVFIAVTNIVVSLLVWRIAAANVSEFIMDIIVWLKTVLLDNYLVAPSKPIPV